MHWLAAGEPGLPDGLGWLAPQEAARLGEIRFTKRRTEFLLRRYAGKRATAAALGLAHDDRTLAGIAILNRLTGAPYVEVAGEPAALDLSLTDRAGWAVALVGSVGTRAAGTVGVDLELAEPRTHGFVEDFFTPAEQDHAAGLTDPEDWQAAVNLIWSAKEAALKVLRVGLRADTRSVEVSLGGPPRPDGWSPLTVTHQDGSVFPGWWRRDGQFLLTTASRQATEPPQPLPGGADLAGARPIHSWLENPVVNP